MAFKFIVLCAFLATARAGVTLSSTSDNTYRSPGNLASISTQSKNIETPYSSSSKTDVRITNPGVYVTAAPEVYASPAYKTVQQPWNYHASLYNAAYPTYNHPVQAQHVYQSPVVAKTYVQPQAYQLPQQYYTPIHHQAPVYPAAAPVHYSSLPHHQPVVKVAYSPAAEVAHLSYSNLNDHVNYAW